MKGKKVSIQTLYLGLYDGPHATPKPSNGGPVFLGISNLTDDGKFDLSDIRHISEEDFSAWTRRVTPQAGDIVFTYEATLNRYAVIPEGFRGCLGRRLALIRPDPQKVNPLFLFYYFFSEDWRKTISQNILSGATVERIPLTTFPTFEVALPSRPEQDNIVSILRAYDDMVENNTRRITILEEMAKMIYREWFVEFRFPGHEKIKMKDSTFGCIPESWRIEPLEHLCARITDGSHWSPKTVPSQYHMASSKDMHQWGLTMCTSRTISESDFASLVRNDCRPLAGDVLITKDGANYLKFCFAAEKDMDVVILSSIALLRPNPSILSSHYLSFCISDPAIKARLAGRVSGVAIPRIVLTDFRRFPVPVPPISIQTNFDQMVQPLIMLCRRLIDKNNNLRRTRDLLLPKIVSGEISVERIETETVAQGV